MSNLFRSLRIFACGVMPFLLILLFILPDGVMGQDPRARRRQFVEDLLRGLIESQLDNNRPVEPPRNPDPNLIPSRPGRNPGGAVVIEVSPQMRAVRRDLDKWNQGCDRLINELRIHENESPVLRPLLADALQLKADVDLLGRKAMVYPSIEPLVNDFRIVNRNWRMLSYHLKYSGGMTKECAKIIESIAKLDTRLCGVFQIEPQVDRAELMRLASQLASDYNHLLHDVYYVVRGRPEGNKILQEGQTLQLMISQTTAFLPRGNYETIVDSYQKCIKKWRQFSRQIRPIQDERIRRSIADIEATGKLINEQLWLPVELDREYLEYISSEIAKDAGLVFGSVSMAQMLDHPNPMQAINAARDFQTACATFSEAIHSGQSKEDLDWKYRMFKVKWQEVHKQFDGLDVQTVAHKIADVDQSMVTLNETFGARPPIDHTHLLQLTANLSALSQQMSFDIHRYVVAPRYEEAFHDSICQNADKMALDANQIHYKLIHDPTVRLVGKDFRDLFDDWRKLKTQMGQCQPEHQKVFNRTVRQLEPLMVKLLVVFSE